MRSMTNVTRKQQIITGQGIAGGYAIGRLRFYRRYRVGDAPVPAKDTSEELGIFASACERAYSQLTELYENTRVGVGEAEADIFDIHRMLLEDEEYTESVENYIYEGQSAASAVMSTAEDFRRMLSSLEDEYLSARAADVEDISRRLYRIITGKSEARLPDSDEPFILVAEDLSPSEAVQLDRSRLLGFVTFAGSKTSHTAILARAMGIPAIIGTGEIPDSLDGENAIIDSKRGELIIEPDLAYLDRYTEKLRRRAEEEKRLRGLIGRPTRTKSGRTVKLYANIGSADEADTAYENDAEGIGLMRSEFLYLGAADYPDEETQYNAYREVVEKMHGRPVIIRTLDIGADKKTDYFSLPREDNPALGFRAIRLCLSRRELFKTQLRAICRASAKGRVSVMLPMIVSVDEVRRAREILVEVKNELRYDCIPFDENIPLGIMIETPAAAMMSGELAREVEFFSVGTNDLTQYTLAADRQNPELFELCRHNIEPVLRLIEITAKNAHAAGIWVGICGELASDTELTDRFLAMGIDELSVSPPCVLALRERITETE